MAACVDEQTPDPTEEVEEVEEAQEAENTNEAEEVITDLTVLAENLEVPWSIGKANDVFYVTERPGTIVKIENGEVNRQNVELDNEVSNEAEAGLLGFTLNPDSNDTQEAFAYYTYNGSEGPTNRIIRLELEGDQWVENQVLLDDVPSGAIHHGGRLAIGQDDKLYATTGDAANPVFS